MDSKEMNIITNYRKEELEKDIARESNLKKLETIEKSIDEIYNNLSKLTFTSEEYYNLSVALMNFDKLQGSLESELDVVRHSISWNEGVYQEKVVRKMNRKIKKME